MKRIDPLYVAWDKSRVRRTRSIDLIPPAAHRRSGKTAYGEWCQIAGLFQALIFTYSTRDSPMTIVDIGCGRGLLVIAASAAMDEGDRYIGLDISAEAIDFCRAHYPAEGFEFVRHDVTNPAYTDHSGQSRVAWSISDSTADVVTALSVWTHLQGPEAKFYLSEVARVLKPGGAAILTLFVRDGQPHTRPHSSRFHRTDPSHWVFDVPASPGWWTTRSAAVPEQAVAIDREVLETLLDDCGLKAVRLFPGSWNEAPGLYFQDVLIATPR